MKERGWTSNLSAVKKSRKNNNHPGKSLAWARKLGKNLTDQQAEKIAFDKLSTKVPSTVKIPASVHLKLY